MSAQSVLFDAPGPKARRRYQLYSVVGLVVVLGVLAVVAVQFQRKGQFAAALWKPFVTDPAVWNEYLLAGIWATLKAAVLSILFAGIFGLLAGMGRLSHIKGVRWLAGSLVEVLRSIPVLIMMLFLGASGGLFYALGIVPDSQVPLVAVVTALALYNGAVIAELVRSGVKGLPSGQREAGLSIGLTQNQTLTLVLLPQALRNMLPALLGQFVVALKDSAIGYVILYPELLTAAKTLGSAYANPVQAYLVAALIFILMNYALTTLAGVIEKRLRSRGGGVTMAAVQADPEELAVAAKPGPAIDNR